MAEMSLLKHSGGLELLCDSKKIHNVNVEPQNGSDKVLKYGLKSVWPMF